MDNSTNLLHTVQGVNAASGNLLATIFLFVIWIGAFAYYKKEDSQDDFLVSSFIASVFAILMLLLDLMTWQFTIMPMVATFVAIIIKNFN